MTKFDRRKPLIKLALLKKKNPHTFWADLTNLAAQKQQVKGVAYTVHVRTSR